MKLIPQFFYALILLVLAGIAHAAMVLPPKYLSVPDWKSCVGEVTRGQAQFICLPAERPDGCPKKSWRALKNLNEIDSCGQ